MTKHMLIDAVHDQETRVVIADNESIEDFDFITSGKAQVKGNIYLAKITRVEPSLQAAFVEYGGGKQGFLPFSEIHPDYYQIPVEDKQRLIEEEEAEARAVEEEEEREEEESSKPRKRRGRSRRRGRNAKSNEAEENNAEDASDKKSDADSDTANDTPDDSGTDYQAARSKTPEVSSEVVEEDDAQDESNDANAEEASAAEAADAVVLESDVPTETDASSEDDSDDDEDDNDVEAETVQTDDVEETQKRRRKGASFKRYKIQEVIKRNQIVLVQVIKGERGNKGVSLTTYISLAGRYCVLMPNSPKAGGVSRKIGNGEQRKKLKQVVAELKESRGLSAIVRTAGIDRTRTEIKRDYEYLVKLWNQIREDTMQSSAPAMIYEESDIIKRSIRDMYSSDVETVMVQGEHAYKDAKAFMKMIMPSHAPRVKLYKASKPIFAEYGVEAQLATMYEPNAKLPSGGSIVLQQTEALISIDVNSGRSTTERNIEETAVKTNMEAAREVARQLRLRDLAGLVVIDFIDMYHGRNRRNLERAMKEALKHDRAKIQMSRISAFGLMELSRQRLRPSIAESSTNLCPHCQGSGFIRSVETVAINIIRILEREAATDDYRRIKIQTYSDVVLHILNDKREMIAKLEEDYQIEIIFEIDPSMITGEHRILKTTEDGKELVHREEGHGGPKRKPRRGRRGGRNRNRDDESSDSDSEESESGADEKTSDDKEKKTHNRRGNRGGRNRRGNRDADKAENTPDSEESSPNQSTQTNSDDNGPDDDKPKRTRRRSPSKKSDGSTRSNTNRRTRKKDDTDSSNEAASTNAEESAEVIQFDEKEQKPEKKPRERKTSSRRKPAEKKETANDSGESSDDSSSDEGPKRKGWWNR